MEAKDTAKHQDNCELSHIKINFGRCTCGAEAQAEISFKAGYEQGGLDSYANDFAEGKRTGIKEVVDWLIKDQDIPVRCAHNATCYDCIDRIRIYWQALKSRITEVDSEGY